MKINKIITNTAPLIDLFEVKDLGGLDILLELYEEVWTSDYIFEKEILYPEKLVEFVQKNIKHKKPREDNLEKALNLFKQVDYGEITCASLYFGGDFEEILMANQDAESLFINEGINVRNILEIAYMALERNIFDEEKAHEYIKRISEEYRPTERVKNIFEKKGWRRLLQGQ